MDYDVFISYNSTNKHIAESVCRSIEERQLRCFIAPRDITPPDWAASVEAAIKHSRAYVVIVSENSIQSKEVGKEVALATNVCDYIFPFRIDNSEYTGAWNYHLSTSHCIDATTPPLDDRINELAELI